MPEMSSYYNAWIAASAAQSTGLSLLAGGALSLLASLGAVPLLPKNFQPVAYRILKIIIAAMVIMLAVILWRA